MPIVYNTGGRVTLGRTSIAISNSENTNETSDQPSPTYSGSIAFNFNLDQWSNATNPSHWSSNENVVDSFYIMGTNVDTGLQSVLYKSATEPTYTPTVNISEYSMDFGETANSLIVHRYENKEANELANQNLGNLLTITTKLKPGYRFTYENDNDLGWSNPNIVRMNGVAVTKNPQMESSNPKLPISDDTFTWKRIHATEDQMTWAVTLNKYPAIDEDFVFFVLDDIRGAVEVLDNNQFTEGLVVTNSTNNTLHDMGSEDSYGPNLSEYSYDSNDYLPLINGQFNLPLENYSDLYSSDYYNVDRLYMELESPVVVRIIATDQNDIERTVYNSEPIFDTGSVEINLEPLENILINELGYYDQAKKVQIIISEY